MEATCQTKRRSGQALGSLAYRLVRVVTESIRGLSIAVYAPPSSQRSHSSPGIHGMFEHPRFCLTGRRYSESSAREDSSARRRSV